MYRLFILLFIIVISGSVYAQEIRYFEIRTSLFKLGNLKIEKTEHNNTTHYKLTSKLRALTFYTIEYLMESTYSEGVMTYSRSKIMVNGDTNHWVENKLIDSVYYIKSFENKSDTILTQPIYSSITPLYFNTYTGPDTIYSEFSGKYKPFVATNDSTIVLDPDNPMDFIFSDKSIARVIIPNSIMDFYIVEVKEEH